MSKAEKNVTTIQEQQQDTTSFPATQESEEQDNSSPKMSQRKGLGRQGVAGLTANAAVLSVLTGAAVLSLGIAAVLAKSALSWVFGGGGNKKDKKPADKPTAASAQAGQKVGGLLTQRHVSPGNCSCLHHTPLMPQHRVPGCLIPLCFVPYRLQALQQQPTRLPLQRAQGAGAAGPAAGILLAARQQHPQGRPRQPVAH